MRTVDIDLASQPRPTASCVVEWIGGAALAQAPRLNLDDDASLTPGFAVPTSRCMNEPATGAFSVSSD